MMFKRGGAAWAQLSVNEAPARRRYSRLDVIMMFKRAHRAASPS
jgi:hypothetical protein